MAGERAAGRNQNKQGPCLGFSKCQMSFLPGEGLSAYPNAQSQVCALDTEGVRLGMEWIAWCKGKVKDGMSKCDIMNSKATCKWV